VMGACVSALLLAKALAGKSALASAREPATSVVVKISLAPIPSGFL
jgi:hypothetical protein